MRMFQVTISNEKETFGKKIIKLFSEFSSLRNTLREDKEALKKFDPSFEVWYQYWFHAGYKSLRLYRISKAFYDSGFKFFGYLFYHLNRVIYSVDIHPAAKISPGVVIDHGTGIVIGSTAEIGRGTVIYHGVTLGAKYITTGKRHPTIGENVVLGAGCKVLGPIYVGNNVKVGANSVVLYDVPDNSTVAGIPARIVSSNKAKSSLEDDSVCRKEIDSIELTNTF